MFIRCRSRRGYQEASHCKHPRLAPPGGRRLVAHSYTSYIVSNLVTSSSSSSSFFLHLPLSSSSSFYFLIFLFLHLLSFSLSSSFFIIFSLFPHLLSFSPVFLFLHLLLSYFLLIFLFPSSLFLHHLPLSFLGCCLDGFSSSFQLQSFIFRPSFSSPLLSSINFPHRLQLHNNLSFFSPS